MERTYVSKIRECSDEQILVKGWIHKIIDYGKFGFIQLRDKTGIIQIVADKELLLGLKIEMSIEVIGSKKINAKAPNGIELVASHIKILGNIYYDMMPIKINEYKNTAHLETQLDYRYISLRSPKERAIFKVQNEITDCFRSFLKANDFCEIHTPKIIASGTEGGSEMFTVNYFDNRAFLAQSPQFYKQMMVGAGFERVFEVGHAYRAELHNTYRHLNEYVSLDVEMGFIKDENDIMDLEENFMRYLFKQLKEKCSDELKIYDAVLPDEINIPRIPLEEARKILLDKFNKKSPIGNIDAEGEELISKYVKQKYDSDFVFLTQYPASKRPMYTMPYKETLTRSFDLIYKGLEITTGGQRIHDYEMFKKNIIKFGLNPDDFSFYLDSFKYGMPPHGGFAIGLERITMKILNLTNIRRASYFPRDMKRLIP